MYEVMLSHHMHTQEATEYQNQQHDIQCLKVYSEKNGAVKQTAPDTFFRKDTS
jgi:hypothetical protein